MWFGTEMSIIFKEFKPIQFEKEKIMKKQNLIQTAIIFIALVVVVSITLDQIFPPNALPASAPATEFSAERAIEHLKVIATEPRLVGKPGYENARDYIMSELTKFGLTPEIQQTKYIHPVENIVARIEGTESTDAILLVAHLDSVSSSPGATDDGSGVVVLLETARAIQAGPPLRNSVIFLFSGPEETGAHGAAAFVKEHPWIEDVKLVLNFDTGGLTGPAELTARSRDNGWLIREAAKADPYFYGTSATGAGDSDYTIAFRPAGFSGFDYQYTWDRRTHSALDNLENLDPNSLQHQGYHALSVTRHFGTLDSLEDPKDPNPIYFNFLRLGVVHYSQKWVIPLMAVVGLVFISIVALGFKRKILNIKGIGLGAVPFILSALSPFLVSVLWDLLSGNLSTYKASYLGHVPNELLLLSFFACFVAALTTTWYALIHKIRSVSIPNLTVSAYVFFAIITVVTALDSPAGSFIFSWPGLVSFLAVGYWFYSAKDEPESFSISQLVVLVFAAVVVVGVMLPDTLGSFMTSYAGDWFSPMIQIVMMLGALMPLVQIATRPNKWWLPITTWGATVMLLVAVVIK
jgi:hypothetical protein